jgi:hypothetical protein
MSILGFPPLYLGLKEGVTLAHLEEFGFLFNMDVVDVSFVSC